MNKISSVFKKSHQLSIYMDTRFPKPCKDTINKNCIIISTDFEEETAKPGIYRYNIITNESEIIYKYTNRFKAEQHGQFINSASNKLILYGGFYNICETFNLQNNTIEITDNNLIRKCETNPQNTFVPSKTDPQIHAIDSQCNHYIFHNTNRQTIKLKKSSELQNHDIHYPKILYIKSKNRLFILGSWFDNKIFSYNNDKWNINKLTMPYSVNYDHYDIINGFGNVLFVFYWEKWELFILDLINMKWYKSNNSIPNEFKSGFYSRYAIKINDSAHIIDFKNNIHFKVCLFNLIPNEIILSHRKLFHPLIIGYLKEKEKQLSLQTIPYVLKILILNYYQLFA